MANVIVCLTVLFMASAFSMSQTAPPTETSASLDVAASGKDFLRICDDPNIAVVRGTCLGYVAGVIDGIHLLCGAPAPVVNSEKPEAMEQKLRTVVQFIKAHPEEAESHTDAIIRKATSEAFPCSPAKSGLGITGDGGQFGARFPWYVQALRKKILDNWLKPELDPALSAQRAYITFDIARDGHPFNLQVAQSSGVPLLDISAVRTLQRINTFGPLPPDWVGDKISVEFWFDGRK